MPIIRADFDEGVVTVKDEIFVHHLTIIVHGAPHWEMRDVSYR